MTKISKLFVLCLVLMALILCMALAGCKKTPVSDTNDDAQVTTTVQAGGSTTEIQVGEEGFMPGDDDVVVGIEGTNSSSSVSTSQSSGTKTSTTKSSSTEKTTKSSAKVSTTTTTTKVVATTTDATTTTTTKGATTTTKPIGTTKSRAPGETPIY